MRLTEPDYGYLAAKKGVHNKEELKQALSEVADSTDLNKKYRDFEHLLFTTRNAERVLRFGEFVKEL